jgi:hypothetical protein
VLSELGADVCEGLLLFEGSMVLKDVINVDVADGRRPEVILAPANVNIAEADESEIPNQIQLKPDIRKDISSTHLWNVWLPGTTRLYTLAIRSL